MKKFLHYGEEVVFQWIEPYRFFESAKENQIELEELPILEYRIFRYHVDGKEKFACMIPDTEEVYITEKIPVNMSWENLIRDCRNQRRGEAPAQLKSKAYLLCEKAIMLAEEIDKENHEDDAWYIPEVKPELFRISLIRYGFNLDELKEMDCRDIDMDFLKDMEG